MKSGFQVLCISLLLFLTSCTTLFYKAYGIKEPEKITRTELENTAVKRFKIDKNNLVLLDSTYKQFCLNHYMPDTSGFNLALQPLQLRIYKNDTLIAFQANCSVGGLFNLKWNRGNYFNTLPPSYLVLKNAPLLSKEYVNTNKLITPKTEYVVLVYYTNFMHRQSKRLLRYAKNLQKIHPDKNLSFVYVNAEELFY